MQMFNPNALWNPGQSNDGVGLSNPEVGQERRKMLDLINKLHNTGVQLDIDLPQIAVIGSQSAGKSSLIESISGVTLPRASGTCTRCPTECRLSRSDSPWQCVVSIRSMTDERGASLGQATTRAFGPVMYKKEEVEERIRRAQMAILNPSIPPAEFLKDEFQVLGSKSELTFSHNCVSLQISGPNVADLSFCDLPGLIASVSGGGNNNDIQLVQNLITSNIEKPSCIILLTVACETDFENQGAHHLTKLHDPHGKRTIGVLTKPDRIPPGETDNWIPYIRNEKEPLENNWFCVKQPSTMELKEIKTWAAARKSENDWFSLTPPWCNLDSIYQKYLRTDNLVERLSKVLSDLISKRLPEIRQEIERHTKNTQVMIDKLPGKPISDPHNTITVLLSDFVHDVNRHIEGVPDDPRTKKLGLIQSIRLANDRFRRAIRETAPNFRPFEKEHADSRHIRKARFLASEEAESVAGEASDDEDWGGGASVDDDWRGYPDDSSDEGQSLISSIPEAPRGQKRKCEEMSDNRIYIDEVMDTAESARTRELPGHFPFVVQQTYIQNIIKEWEDPARSLYQSVYKTVEDHLEKLVSKHFSDFGRGKLEQDVKDILYEHLQRCLKKCESQVTWLLHVENRPSSLDTQYFYFYRTSFLAYYTDERDRYEQADLFDMIQNYGKPDRGAGKQRTYNLQGSDPYPSPAQTQPRTPRKVNEIDRALDSLANIGLRHVKPNSLRELKSNDLMKPALEIMADVRGYFQVAYKRFADYVPHAIDYEIVQGAGRGLFKELLDGLGINGTNGDSICQNLAEESPLIADRRAELMNKYKRLQLAQKELLEIRLRSSKTSV